MSAATQGSAKQMRVLVTGASGTLGFNIVRLLARGDRSAQVTVLMRKLEPGFFGDLPNVTTQIVDVCENVDVRRVVKAVRPHVIVHCAASGVRGPRATSSHMAEVNIDATLALFEASCALAECHFVHISSGLVYREQGRALTETDPLDPVHPYGISKATADAILRLRAVRMHRRLTVVRPFSFTGYHDAGNRLFPSLLRCARSGEPFEMTAGTQLRDFCSVHDVARAVCLLIHRVDGSGVETYNVGSGLAIPLRRLVETVCTRLALRVDLRFGAVALDPLEPMHLVANIARLSTLGWRPEQSVVDAVRSLAFSERDPASTPAAALAYG